MRDGTSTLPRNADRGRGTGIGGRRRRRRRRRGLVRIVHARVAIPNEMGPTRCRATPALRRTLGRLTRRRRRDRRFIDSEDGASLFLAKMLCRWATAYATGA
jgi:hypothetical protein